MNSFQGSVSGSYKVFSASKSYADDKSHEWRKSGAKLDDQLQELNNYHKNDIEWEIVGERIIPKNIRVSKLNKAKFSQSLSFSRVRKELYNTLFRKTFLLKMIDLTNFAERTRFRSY